MTTCRVICHKCAAEMTAPDPGQIDYRMVVIGGRMVPLCLPCYEDRRSHQ